MPLDESPHQTVTRFKCVGFSVYTGFLSFLLLVYIPAKIKMSFI